MQLLAAVLERKRTVWHFVHLYSGWLRTGFPSWIVMIVMLPNMWDIVT